MNLKEFFERVVQLRKFQKEYFATRSRDALRRSIALEKEIDAEIEHIQTQTNDKTVEPPNLFNNE